MRRDLDGRQRPPQLERRSRFVGRSRSAERSDEPPLEVPTAPKPAPAAKKPGKRTAR